MVIPGAGTAQMLLLKGIDGILSLRMVVSVRAPHRNCYICHRSDVKLTDDHIPPEGFFPEGQREDLFTAPLCEDCHRPLSMDDEIMPFFLASVEGASESASLVWEKAYERIRAKEKLWNNIKPYLVEKNVRLEDGRIEQRVMAGLLQGRAIPFIRRLTKGFLYLFYPEYDYQNDHFTAGMAQFDRISALLTILKRHEQRGREVFEMWHGQTIDTGDSGAFVYRFYGSIYYFFCFHSKRERYKQEFPSGYEEWPGLPPKL